MKKSILFMALCCLAGSALAAVQGKEVSYQANGTTLKGYVAYDDAIELGKKFNLPLVYNAAADKDSWQQATVFLQEVFAK